MILNVAKEIIVCIRPIHRKSEGSSHDIRYIKHNTHGFHELYALFFAEETNLNFNSYLTVVHSFTLHSTTNLLKANKAIPALFFMMSSKPQELKPLDWSKIHRYARHSHYKYKQTLRGKKDEEEKMPDLRLSNVFQLPCRRISRRWTRRGTNLVIFF